MGVSKTPPRGVLKPLNFTASRLAAIESPITNDFGIPSCHSWNRLTIRAAFVVARAIKVSLLSN
jgi:hypothetical protein